MKQSLLCENEHCAGSAQVWLVSLPGIPIVWVSEICPSVNVSGGYKVCFAALSSIIIDRKGETIGTRLCQAIRLLFCNNPFLP